MNSMLLSVDSTPQHLQMLQTCLTYRQWPRNLFAGTLWCHWVSYTVQQRMIGTKGCSFPRGQFALQTCGNATTTRYSMWTILCHIGLSSGKIMRTILNLYLCCIGYIHAISIVMIHPNFSHPCQTPSSSPYPNPHLWPSNHYHWTCHPYQTCHPCHPMNHPNHRHPLISPQSSPSSPSHGTSIVGNTPQWRCTKSHPQ